MRIAISGPQNTGKTTFVKDFLAAFPTYMSPTETYRDVVRDGGLAINRKTTEDSQRAIRDFIAEQIKTTTGDDVIFDRCLLDNYIYTLAQHRNGGIGQEFLNETASMMRDSFRGLDALVFIPTASDIAFEEDDVRDTDPGFANLVNSLFIETLLMLKDELPRTIVVLSGTRAERIELIRERLALSS
jgi:hypothetical protein